MFYDMILRWIHLFKYNIYYYYYFKYILLLLINNYITTMKRGNYIEMKSRNHLWIIKSHLSND